MSHPALEHLAVKADRLAALRTSADALVFTTGAGTALDPDNMFSALAGHTQVVARSGEEIVRRVVEIISESGSADVAMAELEHLMNPEIEFVNPDDAIERGPRAGEAGIRTVLESFVAGAGGGASFEREQVRERGGRVFTITRIHARGALSGVEVLGPPTGAIWTIRDERIFRIEWHYDVDEALDRFEQDG